MKTIRQLREERWLWQFEIADVLGLDERTYRRYESGESVLRGDHLQKLARYYGISSDEIDLKPEKGKNTRLGMGAYSGSSRSLGYKSLSVNIG